MKKISTFSKALFGLGLFIGSSFAINAQDVAFVNHSELKKEVKKTMATLKYAESHNDQAVAQISKHIATHINYPDQAISYGVEGVVVVEIKIAPNGKIEESRIVKRLSDQFDSAVLKAISDLDKIDLNESTYEGFSTVHIPVRFTNSL